MPDQVPAVAAFASKLVFPHLYRPGLWYGTVGTFSTSASFSNASLKVAPFVVSARTRFDQAGLEITSAGEAGSVVRMGIYDDDGAGYPSTLIADFGTVPGAAIANPTVNINLTLNPGLYWLGAAIQNAPTTRPTIRILSNTQQFIGVAAPAITTQGAISYGAPTGQVPGALPAVFSVFAVGGLLPRVVLRAA